MMRLPSSSFPSFKPGRTAAFVENADLMPTLSELALGLGDAVPRCPRDAKASRAIELCTEGLSFAPLLTRSPTTPWKAASFSQYQRLSFTVMGYSMRTEGWRFTMWVPFNTSRSGYPDATDWNSSAVQSELYKHSVETKPCDWSYEHENLAGQPAYAHTEAALREGLIAGWRAALPPSVE